MFLLCNSKRIKSDKKNVDLEFDLIIKQNNNIYCYKNDKIILSLEGISNINNYSVEGGEFSYSQKAKEELQTEINANLLKDSAKLQIELNKQKELSAMLLMQIAKLGG